MSLETRSNSALFKRAEQLRRWEESETNRETPVPKNKNRKIQFSAGCVFLAACAAGDKEEVLRLIQMGADIDTANVDGLTALHQACIDDNLDMVEFLVEHGADVNRGDNEGWTPLHATASCGFISIAKYLIEHGGNVAAVNNDGELPVDIAESDEMEEMLQQYINSQGIDCDEARNEEERIMLEDAKEWLNSGDLEDIPHPKTGATALHVAAAKGYIKVMSVHLQGGADVNIQDFDGWTPLHAAAHWGQKEACEILVENFCDMDMKNYVGQTAFDVADTEMFRFLEELKKKQAALQRDRGDINILQKKATNHAKRGSSITRMSVNDKSNLINKDASLDRQLLDQNINEEGNNKVKKVELEIETEPEREEPTIPLADKEVEKKNKANRDDPSRFPAVPEVKSVPNAASGSPPKTTGEAEDSIGEWRQPGSFRTRVAEQAKPLTLRIGEKATTPPGPETRNSVEPPEVVLRRTQSFESDEKRAPREDLKINSNALSTTTSTVTTTVATTTTTTATSPTATSPLPTSQVRSVSTPSTPTTPGGSKLSPGNIFKNFFKSFVPPVRDEESETQRKAHAKRVRETRRSTQGVTLEEIKSAEQLVKKKNQQQLHQATQQLSNNDQPSVIIPTTSSTSITATITTATPTVPSSGVPKEEVPISQDRRPSWRLRVDNGDRSKFMLEDVRSKGGPSESTAAYIRRPVGSSSTPVRPSSAPVEVSTPDTSVTLALRRQTKPPDDKDQDKENDIRNAQATQAVIQRRRRPKRRSTGVVMPDEVDPDRQESPGREGDDYSKMNNEESGGELSGHSSRLSSVSGGSGDASVSNSNSRSGTPAHSAKDGGENGELDFKKLYEQSLAENDRLREKLKKTEDELHEAKTQLENTSVANVKNSSEMEKRERRAMERKLSEMEEELKQLQKLKAENERLKAENRALTRVVSKLTNSAHATK